MNHPFPQLPPRPLGRSLVLFPAIIVFVVFVTASTAGSTSSADQDREAVIKLVGDVQRADYAADRAALHRLYDELAPFARNKELSSRVEYWRGFALWRSAINGFNDKADRKELQQDLNRAVEAFDRSLAADPNFVDSKIAMVSCLGYLAYSLEPGTPQQQDYIARSRQALQEARAAAPDNPRLLWVLGPVYWNVPPERGGGQDKAMAAMEKGLNSIRSQKNTTTDPLDPSWGEPELLMSLAWYYLNRSTPDLAAAEQNASSALRLVPNWHYVRDILMQQIRDAKAKRTGGA